MTHEAWHVTHDSGGRWIFSQKSSSLDLTVLELKVTPAIWHLTPDTWHLTCDRWHVTYDMCHVNIVVNIVSKFQVPSSNGLAFMMFWRFGWKGWLSYLIYLLLPKVFEKQPQLHRVCWSKHKKFDFYLNILDNIFLIYFWNCIKIAPTLKNNLSTAIGIMNYYLFTEFLQTKTKYNTRPRQSVPNSDYPDKVLGRC